MFDQVNDEKNNINKDKPANPPALESGMVPASRGLPAQAGLPPKTEDIFAEVDKGAKAKVFKPKIAPPFPIHNLNGEERPGFFGEKKKFFVLGLIVIFLVLIFAGGLFVLNKILQVNSPNKAEDNLKMNSKSQAEEKRQETQVPSLPAPAQEQEEQAIVPPAASQPLDSDQDGLTDEEENQIRTNINSPDSDNDGLFDREEVKVYGTDPLNPDTDGDGYLDGEEVKSGYNPKGSGRLYEIK